MCVAIDPNNHQTKPKKIYISFHYFMCFVAVDFLCADVEMRELSTCGVNVYVFEFAVPMRQASMADIPWSASWPPHGRKSVVAPDGGMTP